MAMIQSIALTVFFLLVGFAAFGWGFSGIDAVIGVAAITAGVCYLIGVVRSM